VSGKRLTGRDYKGVRRGGLERARLRDLGTGLALGLLVAFFIYVSDHRHAAGGSDVAAEAGPAPRHGTARNAGTAAGAGATDVATEAAEDASGGYDFYAGLPKFEVVVPEKEHGAHVDAAARVDRPGTYFLQAGSYRNSPDAERVQAQLARQGISASVQRVALDNDVWYRIRIGPIKDLNQLNRLRQQLQAAEIVTLVIRVEE
jgi:cell division protein FtsN